jgi:hypothetical protein
VASITAYNQTAGDLAVDDLPFPDQKIAASGNVIATDYATVREIQESGDLLIHVNAGNVLLQFNSDTTWTQAESQAFFEGTIPNTNQPVKTVTFQSEYNNGNSGATPTITWGNGQKQRITMTAAATFSFVAPSGPSNLLLKVIQDATGWTVTWPGTVLWPGGTAPTLSGANATDIVAFYYDGTNYFGVASLDFS